MLGKKFFIFFKLLALKKPIGFAGIPHCVATNEFIVKEYPGI